MEEVRYCEKCGKQFVVKYASITKRFCSHKCSSAWKWENVRERQKYLSVPCANCGKELNIPLSDHRIKEKQKYFFCNKKCYSEHATKHREIKYCLICGNAFYKNRRKRFCSGECAITHKRYLSYKRHHNEDISLENFLVLSKRTNVFSFAGRESQYQKEYRQKNRTRISKQKREKELSSEVLHYACRIKKNIQQAYRRNNELSEQMLFILGCSMSEFSKHIESQFTEGMTRENYGEWQLDHIIPISSARSKQDVDRLCHYTNYQPLWRINNIRKGAKLQPLKKFNYGY